jgi:hypothetical protein
VFLSRFEAFNKERKGKYQTEYQIDSDWRNECRRISGGMNQREEETRWWKSR